MLAARDVKAEELGIQAGLICSRGVAEAVSSRKPPCTTVQDLADAGVEGWRLEVLGEDFLKAIAEDDSPRRSAFSNSRLLFDPFDICAELAEPCVQVLVAPFDLADIVDDALALGDEGGDDQRHAGADVRARQVLTAEL